MSLGLGCHRLVFLSQISQNIHCEANYGPAKCETIKKFLFQIAVLLHRELLYQELGLHPQHGYSFYQVLFQIKNLCI